MSCGEGLTEGLAVQALLLGTVTAAIHQGPVVWQDMSPLPNLDAGEPPVFTLLTRAGHQLEISVRLTRAANGDAP